MQRQGPGSRDPEYDPHSVYSAERGVVTCRCGAKFTGRWIGDAWDDYYHHWRENRASA